MLPNRILWQPSHSSSDWWLQAGDTLVLTDSYVELQDWRAVVDHADKALALLEDEAQITRVHRKKGIALWAQDRPADALTVLTGKTEGTKDIRVLLALGWSQTLVEKGSADAMVTAKAALAFDGKNICVSR